MKKYINVVVLCLAVFIGYSTNKELFLYGLEWDLKLSQNVLNIGVSSFSDTKRFIIPNVYMSVNFINLFAQYPDYYMGHGTNIRGGVTLRYDILRNGWYKGFYLGYGI